jgi:hypothetical protein
MVSPMARSVMSTSMALGMLPGRALMVRDWSCCSMTPLSA